MIEDAIPAPVSRHPARHDSLQSLDVGADVDGRSGDRNGRRVHLQLAHAAVGCDSDAAEILTLEEAGRHGAAGLVGVANRQPALRVFRHFAACAVAEINDVDLAPPLAPLLREDVIVGLLFLVEAKVFKQKNFFIGAISNSLS